MGRTRTTRRLPARGRFFSFIPEQQDEQTRPDRLGREPGFTGAHARTVALQLCTPYARIPRRRGRGARGRSGAGSERCGDLTVAQLTASSLVGFVRGRGEWSRDERECVSCQVAESRRSGGGVGYNIVEGGRL